MSYSLSALASVSVQDFTVDRHDGVARLTASRISAYASASAALTNLAAFCFSSHNFSLIAIALSKAKDLPLQIPLQETHLGVSSARL
jgi:hypothetical protein